MSSRGAIYEKCDEWQASKSLSSSIGFSAMCDRVDTTLQILVRCLSSNYATLPEIQIQRLFDQARFQGQHFRRSCHDATIDFATNERTLCHLCFHIFHFDGSQPPLQRLRDELSLGDYSLALEDMLNGMIDGQSLAVSRCGNSTFTAIDRVQYVAFAGIETIAVLPCRQGKKPGLGCLPENQPHGSKGAAP